MLLVRGCEGRVVVSLLLKLCCWFAAVGIVLLACWCEGCVVVYDVLLTVAICLLVFFYSLLLSLATSLTRKFSHSQVPSLASSLTRKFYHSLVLSLALGLILILTRCFLSFRS